MGTGDPLGCAIPHTVASGMGGLRTAGDLVARMQMTRAMRLDAAKAHVADRLGVSVADLHDEPTMREVRSDLRLGTLQHAPGEPKGMEAKMHIAERLGIAINSVARFRQRTP